MCRRFKPAPDHHLIPAQVAKNSPANLPIWEDFPSHITRSRCTFAARKHQIPLKNAGTNTTERNLHDLQTLPTLQRKSFYAIYAVSNLSSLPFCLNQLRGRRLNSAQSYEHLFPDTSFVWRFMHRISRINLLFVRQSEGSNRKAQYSALARWDFRFHLGTCLVSYFSNLLTTNAKLRKALYII